MFDKVNIIDIVIDHYKTLISFRTKKPKILDYVLFLGIPTAVAALAYYCKIIISSNSASVITTAVTILTGLLFNLLILIHTVNNRNEVYTTKKDTDQFFIEIYANISYSILISLLFFIPLAYLSFADNANVASSAKDALVCASDIVIFLSVHLFLTLLMILKRIHYLLRHEFNQHSRNSNNSS